MYSTKCELNNIFPSSDLHVAAVWKTICGEKSEAADPYCANQRPCCYVEVDFIFFPPGLGREFETESIKNKRTDSSGDWTGWRIVSQTIWPWRPPPSPTQGGVIYQLHSSEHTWTLQRFIWWKLCCHVKKTSSEWNKKPDGHFKLKDNIRLKFGNISAHQVQQRRTSERGVIFWEKIQIKVVNSQD